MKSLARHTIEIAVRLAHENPHEPASTIADWAEYEAEELHVDASSCPSGDRDEPKDHAYNDVPRMER